MYYADREYVWKEQPLDWQRAGLQQTASGYGSKLADTRMVRLERESVWRRVYITCYGNGGSAFIMVNGKRRYFAGGMSFGWWNEHHTVRTVRVLNTDKEGKGYYTRKLDFWHPVVNTYVKRGHGLTHGVSVGDYGMAV